jgi:hypothetical protein
MNTDKKAIKAFYDLSAPDNQGRFLYEIWRWDFEDLETVHNYIQWLFPLNRPSQFNQNAPILTETEIREFNNSGDLKKNLLKSTELLLRFYGFEIQHEDGIKIIKAIHFHSRSKYWITRNNHNFLRITRILRSLKMLGLTDYCLAFYRVLEEVYSEPNFKSIIGEKTFQFWKHAALV